MAGDTLDVFWHPAALGHDTGRGFFGGPASEYLDFDEAHPENADRVRNMHAVLKRGPIAEHLRWHDGRRADEGEIARFHTAEHIATLRAADVAGGHIFSASTLFVADSYEATLIAAGTALAAMDRVMTGDGGLAYALVRPPGHHAAPDAVDGYCFVNNSALAALRAIEHGAKRVAVIDWDVHHGNGTQEGFYARDDVLTVSMHMDHGAWGPNHLQTGKADEVGRGAGRGLNVNVPMPMGSGDAGYIKAFEDIVVPAVDAFAPETIVVACGQDANQFDPNGRQMVSMAGFRRLGAMARALVDRHAGGRLCLVQEGGYAMSYAAYCLHATLEGVLGVGPLLDDPIAFYPEDTGPALAAIEGILATRAAAIAAGD